MDRWSDLSQWTTEDLTDAAHTSLLIDRDLANEHDDRRLTALRQELARRGQ